MSKLLLAELRYNWKMLLAGLGGGVLLFLGDHLDSDRGEATIFIFPVLMAAALIFGKTKNERRTRQFALLPVPLNRQTISAFTLVLGSIVLASMLLVMLIEVFRIGSESPEWLQLNSFLGFFAFIFPAMVTIQILKHQKTPYLRIGFSAIIIIFSMITAAIFLMAASQPDSAFWVFVRRLLGTPWGAGVFYVFAILHVWFGVWAAQKRTAFLV